MGGDFQLLSLLEASGVLDSESIHHHFVEFEKGKLVTNNHLSGGSLHYGSMFYFPGQIFFIIALRCQERRKTLIRIGHHLIDANDHKSLTAKNAICRVVFIFIVWMPRIYCDFIA